MANLITELSQFYDFVLLDSGVIAGKSYGIIETINGTRPNNFYPISAAINELEFLLSNFSHYHNIFTTENITRELKTLSSKIKTDNFELVRLRAALRRTIQNLPIYDHPYRVDFSGITKNNVSDGDYSIVLALFYYITNPENATKRAVVLTRDEDIQNIYADILSSIPEPYKLDILKRTKIYNKRKGRHYDF